MQGRSVEPERVALWQRGLDNRGTRIETPKIMRRLRHRCGEMF